MWLTGVLCRRWTPGSLWFGKNRLERKLTACRRRNLRKQDERVENNDRLLTVPFLSQAQEAGHAVERRKEEKAMFREVLKISKAKKMVPHVYAFGPGTSKNKGILDHLNVSKSQHS